MKNKFLFVLGLVLAFAFIAFAAQPLYQSFLQSDMNGNKYSITNVAVVQASNVVAQTMNATTFSGTYYGDGSHLTGVSGGSSNGVNINFSTNDFTVTTNTPTDVSVALKNPGGGGGTNGPNYQFYGNVQTNASPGKVLVNVLGSGNTDLSSFLSPTQKIANFLSSLGTASNALVDAACLNSEFNNTTNPKTIFGRQGTTYGSPTVGINGLRFSRVPAKQRTLFPWGNYTNFTFIVVCSGPTNEVDGTQSGAPFSYGNITNDGFSLPGTPLADGRFMRPVRYQQNMALRVGDNDATGLHGFSRAFWLHDHVSWLADGLGNKNIVLNNSQRIWSMSGDGTNLFVMLEGIGTLATNIPNGYWTSSIPANVLSFGNTAVSTEVIGGLTNSMDGVVMSWAFFNRILSTNEIIAVNRAITWFDPSQEKVIFVGDSRTTQTAGQFGNEYPFKLMSKPNFFFRRSFNEAEYSVKARDVQTNGYLETRVSMWSNSPARTIALVHIGINDWTNQDTVTPGIPAVVVNYISNICTKLKGWGMETWYITEGGVNGTYPGFAIFCHGLNDLIIADPAKYKIDRLIRRDLVFTDAVMGNGTYADGTHLTPLGNQILADYIATNAIDVKAIDVPPWLPADGGTIYGDLTVSGTVTANAFVGDGSTLTGIGQNANGNTVIGESALNNFTPYYNSAFGIGALQGNVSGLQNTALGAFALNIGSSNGANTAIGFNTLSKGWSAANVAVGANALTYLTGGGGNNTAIGTSAGSSGGTGANNLDTAVDSQSTFIGAYSGRDASVPNATPLVNATAIGYGARVGANNALVLGNSSVNVGIGTATPAAKLDVAGTIRTTSITFTTNTASLALDMLLEQADYDITGDITLTAPINVSATEVRTTVVGLYNTTGSARTITVPGAWHSGDGSGSYVIGTGVTNAIISVQTRGMRVTNVAYKAFGR